MDWHPFLLPASPEVYFFLAWQILYSFTHPWNVHRRQELFADKHKAEEHNPNLLLWKIL